MRGADVVEVLRRVGGRSMAADLVAICGREALARAVGSGAVLRIARGRYALPGLPGLPDPWNAAFRLGGVVSHTSAAQHWGMSVLSPAAEAHITLARSRSRVPRDGVRVHWSELAISERDADLPVTTPIRTVLDCARTLPLGEALAVADSALRQRLVGPEELQRAADALSGPGRARCRRAASLADGRAESGLESVLRGIFVVDGIKSFVPQYVIRDENFFARVDLADERRRLVAEADSFEHHGYRQALVRDCERYDELVIRGWRVLRFAWEQVMFRPEWVVAVTRAALAGQRARPANRRKAA